MQASFGLLPPGAALCHPLFDRVLRQDATPTSSADEADLIKRVAIKSPLAKNDQASAAGPSESEDSGAEGVVESPPAVEQPLPLALPLPEACYLPVPALPMPPADMHAAAAAAVASASGRGAGAPPTLPAPWLMGLFNVSLFEHHGCRCHPGLLRNGTLKRNENNQYCLECSHATGAGMCKLCLPGHAACCSGRVFQIRKYMYQTCVHVDDIQPLYDVSGVQAYCINSRRAVLIHPKNVEKEQKCPAFDHTCLGCQKPLRNDCTYCSLRCKVDVEFGFAPITPKSFVAGGLPAARDSSGAVPAAVAAVLAAQPRFLPAAPIPRPAPSAKRPAQQYSAAAAAALQLDVSHATKTQCSSGTEGSSSGSKRRKSQPARSFIS